MCRCFAEKRRINVSAGTTESALSVNPTEYHLTTIGKSNNKFSSFSCYAQYSKVIVCDHLLLERFSNAFWYDTCFIKYYTVLPDTKHEPNLPLLPRRKSSKHFGRYSLDLPTVYGQAELYWIAGETQRKFLHRLNLEPGHVTPFQVTWYLLDFLFTVLLSIFQQMGHTIPTVVVVPDDDDDDDDDDDNYQITLSLHLCLFVYVVAKEEIDWTLVIMAISLAASVAIIVILVCVICATCIKSQTRSGKSFKSTNLPV